MDENTLRILITSIASSIAVITTALFGYFTHVRKDKITNLEKRLAWTLRQYKSLYRVEKLYLAELEKQLERSAGEIKKEFRKVISDDGNDHIELTDTEVRKKLQRL